MSAVYRQKKVFVCAFAYVCVKPTKVEQFVRFWLVSVQICMIFVFMDLKSALFFLTVTHINPAIVIDVMKSSEVTQIQTTNTADGVKCEI